MFPRGTKNLGVKYRFLIENLETLSDGYFCFMGDGEIIVSSIADHAEIIAILKYSLQGTTQGNGLTGGVPPVRFSM